jgi:26S proteasome regulatory subunit N2
MQKDGGLSALGLKYATYFWDNPILEIVTRTIRTTTNLVVQHGGCLTLGLIAIGSHKQDFYDLMKHILDDENPESREAVDYAIVMIMLGCGSGETIQEFITLCRNNEHENVILGVTVGLALMMYGREDDNEPFIQSLRFSRMPLMSESAGWIRTFASVGTASSVAL